MKRGFSLVELSIVLVILGLLVGGILAGKSLIHAAELRTVSRDFNKYATAVFSFRDKYFALPGDITNATQFWGAADGDDGLDASGNSCTSVLTTDGTTCNGNGDGTIGTASGQAETLRAWQHLGSAGMIEGSYTGAQDTVNAIGNVYLNPGVNVPKSTISKGMFLLGGVGTGWALGVKFAPAGTGIGIQSNAYSGMYVALARPVTSTAAGPAAAPFFGVLSHEDAWNIDTKMDDGVAGSGKVRAEITKMTGAGIAITDMTCATYDLTNTTNYCVLASIFGGG